MIEVQVQTTTNQMKTTYAFRGTSSFASKRKIFAANASPTGHSDYTVCISKTYHSDFGFLNQLLASTGRPEGNSRLLLAMPLVSRLSLAQSSGCQSFLYHESNLQAHPAWTSEVFVHLNLFWGSLTCQKFLINKKRGKRIRCGLQEILCHCWNAMRYMSKQLIEQEDQISGRACSGQSDGLFNRSDKKAAVSL